MAQDCSPMARIFAAVAVVIFVSACGSAGGQSSRTVSGSSADQCETLKGRMLAKLDAIERHQSSLLSVIDILGAVENNFDIDAYNTMVVRYKLMCS